MKKIISFEVPGNPKSLKRHRTFGKGKFTYDPSDGDKADFLAKAMLHKPDQPLDCPLYVAMRFYFPRPKSHFGTGKNSNKLKDSAPSYHTSTPDADNLAKFVCDALNGIFWSDDRIISQLFITKTYSDTPQVGITIAEL